MHKIIVFSFLFLLVTAVPAQASSLKDEKEKYDMQQEAIQEEISSTEDKEELIDLKKQENEIASFQRAYDVAINYNAAHRSRKGNNMIQEGLEIDYIEIYKSAAEVYKVNWELLAAVHKTETNFSKHPTMVSSAGAVGHMQFMPATWEYYGVDASGDGKADPWDIEDAIFSAAYYLADTGAAEGDTRSALFHYNRSTEYGNEVISLADSYKEAYSTNNKDVVNVGKKYINDSTYVFGGGRNQADINKGVFDCSSFVHWAFSEVGKDVGALGTTTTDTLKRQGDNIAQENIKPGDLVFFDTYKKDGHVGIYAGNGQFIGAQQSTGVAIADMTSGYWQEKFNGRVQRL